MQRPRALIYEFGEFLVDVDRRLLLGRAGRPLPLTPKVFDTLLYLVEHTETVLDKDTLMNAIWPGTIVEENSLNQNISLLRRVLGGKRSEHRYIVTVPGHGYRFVASVKKCVSTSTTGSAATVRRVAVLPFQPLVREDRDASLEMGMADTLIARLSGLRGMIVRPITSVSKYAGLGQDALSAGRELDVESVLEGSLQRHGNKIRVTVRLLSVPTGVSLWAGTFDEELTDIFALQDAISERVVRALALELSSEDRTRLTKHHTENTEAYDLYLKGRYYWWNNSPGEYSKSRDYFHRAVDADPSYALGYCGLNSYYGFGAAFGMLPAEEAWPKAEWAIRKALDLDDTLAEAHLGLAALNMVYYLDWAATEKEARRAIELNPQFDEIHFMYSFFLMVMRRFDESIIEGKRAAACDPFSVRISQHLGSVYYHARRYDEAIRQYQRTLELNPHNASVHESLGDACEQSGRHREAVGQWKKAAALNGDGELSAILSATDSRLNLSSVVRALAAKKVARLAAMKKKGDCVPAINFARAYLRMDDKARAFQWLKTACEERNVYALMLGSDPLYDPLRADRHFTNLLRRIRLCV
jgi:DNA-binding winged helix-turn-helix (wHTH) protein/tetratricopeptide (TPR) repeat protein